MDLTSCRNIFNAAIPEFILFGNYEMSSMNWSKPMCGNCEAQGEECQLKKKSNSREPEIQCIPKPAKGTLTTLLLYEIFLWYVVVMSSMNDCELAFLYIHHMLGFFERDHMLS